MTTPASPPPRVSVITPSYNQGRFIERTILSVKRQDYENLEHIIVDGGSTDSTLSVLRRYEGTYSMLWISEPDSGQADAINKGLAKASGAILSWLNSDDVYLFRGVVSDMVARFATFPDAHVIHGNDVLMDEDDRFLCVRRLTELTVDGMLRQNAVSQPTAFFRADRSVGRYLDPSLHYTMDYEFWLRLHCMGLQFKHVDALIAGNRIHASRKMLRGRMEADAEVQNVKRTLDLRPTARRPFRSAVDGISGHLRRVIGILDVLALWSARDQTPLNLKDSLLTLLGNQLLLTRLRAVEKEAEKARTR